MPAYRPQRAASLALAAVCAVIGLSGCKQGPFQPVAAGVAQPAGTSVAAATTAQSNVWQQQAQSLAVQVQDLTRRVGQLDVNNSDLHRQLAQAEQQRTQYTDQIALLQKQLGEMANKVRDTTLAKQEADKQLTALQASTQFRGGASISANNSVRQSLTPVSLPGINVRQEGEVIRIELPADKLFAPGSAQLLPDGVRILDEVAGAITRSYPRQRVIIEGHTDNSASFNPAAAHMLSGGQAQAVFQQFVQRNHLPQRQLSILAMGENHPIASNATPAGQSANRRVEVVIYPDTLD
jgi:flagellar motor protein MotB